MCFIKTTPSVGVDIDKGMGLSVWTFSHTFYLSIVWCKCLAEKYIDKFDKSQVICQILPFKIAMSTIKKPNKQEFAQKLLMGNLLNFFSAKHSRYTVFYKSNL